MKFTDEQKELIALLPKEVRGDKDLTDSAKLVLGDLILWWGIDFAEDNGYIFRTNEDIMKDTGLGSNNTIINAIRQLKQKGLISTKRGKRHSASEYILDEKLHDKKCTIQTQNCTSKLHDNTKSALLNNDTLIEDMQLTINDLLKRIETLEEEIALLKSQNCTSKKCTNETKKCTTDTDTETDTEKESRIMDQGNEIEHEWNDSPIDFEYQDEMRKIGLSEVGNAEVKCLAQCQDNNLNESTKVKPNGSSNATSYSDKNKWVTWYFDEMNSNLSALANSKTKVTIEGLQDKIADLLQIGLDKIDDFTDKQWTVVQNFADRFIKLMEIKQQYLKGGKNTDTVQAPINNASDVYSDDEWATKVEHSFNTEEATKVNSSSSSDSSKEEELKPQKSEAEELNDHMLKMFNELDEQDKTLESKVQSTLTWDTLPF